MYHTQEKTFCYKLKYRNALLSISLNKKKTYKEPVYVHPFTNLCIVFPYIYSMYSELFNTEIQIGSVCTTSLHIIHIGNMKLIFH